MKVVFCFGDDVLIAGKDVNDHNTKLQSVLQKIKDHGLRIKKQKCLFAVKELEFLGFKITDSGIHKTNDKIKAIKEAKTPTNINELQSFLGLVTFYAKFIPRLSTIASPLYALLKADIKWNWNISCEKSINDIKKEITSKRFLCHYNRQPP